MFSDSQRNGTTLLLNDGFYVMLLKPSFLEYWWMGPAMFSFLHVNHLSYKTDFYIYIFFFFFLPTGKCIILTVQEPCSTPAGPQLRMAEEDARRRHWVPWGFSLLLMLCLGFFCLLFNGSDFFFAASRSYLARDVLCVIDSEKSFRAMALSLTVLSCRIPHCHVSQLTFFPGLLTQGFWGVWNKCCTALLQL